MTEQNNTVDLRDPETFEAYRNDTFDFQLADAISAVADFGVRDAEGKRSLVGCGVRLSNGALCMPASMAQDEYGIEGVRGAMYVSGVQFEDGAGKEAREDFVNAVSNVTKSGMAFMREDLFFSEATAGFEVSCRPQDHNERGENYKPATSGCASYEDVFTLFSSLTELTEYQQAVAEHLGRKDARYALNFVVTIIEAEALQEAAVWIQFFHAGLVIAAREIGAEVGELVVTFNRLHLSDEDLPKAQDHIKRVHDLAGAVSASGKCIAYPNIVLAPTLSLDPTEIMLTDILLSPCMGYTATMNGAFGIDREDTKERNGRDGEVGTEGQVGIHGSIEGTVGIDGDLGVEGIDGFDGNCEDDEEDADSSWSTMEPAQAAAIDINAVIASTPSEETRQAAPAVDSTPVETTSSSSSSSSSSSND